MLVWLHQLHLQKEMFPQAWLRLNLLKTEREFQCRFCFPNCAHCHNYASGLFIYSTYRVNWVEVDGTMYKKPCALLLTVDEEAPTFGKLLDIYVVGSVAVYFKVQPLEYNSHCHCFIVKYSEVPAKILSCTSLFSFVPHHVRILPGTISTLCVVPKTFFCPFLTLLLYVLHFILH